jgi:hypothetical protein
MNVQALLEDLTSRGVQLTPDGDGLVVRPASKLTDSDRQAIRTHKPELLAVLNPPREGRRLDSADCGALIREAFEVLEYVDGALALLETDPDLCRRFHDTEAAIDAVAKTVPTEAEFRGAVTAHVAVIRECVERKRAQREAAADLADPIPELPGDQSLDNESRSG